MFRVSQNRIFIERSDIAWYTTSLLTWLIINGNGCLCVSLHVSHKAYPSFMCLGLLCSYVRWSFLHEPARSPWDHNCMHSQSLLSSTFCLLPSLSLRPASPRLPACMLFWMNAWMNASSPFSASHTLNSSALAYLRGTDHMWETASLNIRIIHKVVVSLNEASSVD